MPGEYRRDEIIALVLEGIKEKLLQERDINTRSEMLRHLSALSAILNNKCIINIDLSKCEIIAVDTGNTGYSECRLMIDCESDDRSRWIEMNHDDHPLRLRDGDIVIQRK